VTSAPAQRNKVLLAIHGVRHDDLDANWRRTLDEALLREGTESLEARGYQVIAPSYWAALADLERTGIRGHIGPTGSAGAAGHTSPPRATLRLSALSRCGSWTQPTLHQPPVALWKSPPQVLQTPRRAALAAACALVYEGIRLAGFPLDT
jgi:hypothetical protein